MHFEETEEQAVLKEVDEEVGIKVKILGKVLKVYWDENPSKMVF